MDSYAHTMRKLALLLLIIALPASAQTVIMGASHRKVFAAAGGGTPTLNAHFGKQGIDRNRGGSTSGGTARIFQLDANGMPGAVTSGSLVIMAGAWPDNGTGGPHSCTSP